MFPDDGEGRPASGLALEPTSHWDVMGGPRPSSWSYRVEQAGPTATAWRTLPAGAVLHLRWQVDPHRPWAGVSPLQHAADTGSLSAWLERRLSEEASGPVGAFLPVAKYEPGADVDLNRPRRRRSARAAPGRHRQRQRPKPCWSKVESAKLI